MIEIPKIPTPLEVLRTDSPRWQMNIYDWMHVHWAVIWSGLGAGTAYMSLQIQVHVIPILHSRGTWGIVAALILAFVTQTLIQLLLGPAKPKVEDKNLPPLPPLPSRK